MSMLGIVFDDLEDVFGFLDENKEPEVFDFGELYEMQGQNQRCMLRRGMYHGLCSEKTEKEAYNIELPIDDTKLFSYHVQQLMSEVGELLDADKRWKNFRNGKYDRDQKLDELADCFIVLMNIAMFSGYTTEEFFTAVAKKIAQVSDRIQHEPLRCKVDKDKK